MGIFSLEEDLQIIKSTASKQTRSWSEVFSDITSKSAKQCSDRYTKYILKNYSKIKWTDTEDSLLIEHIKKNGEVSFDSIFDHISALQAAMRWFHHLKPNMVAEYFSNSWNKEDDQILEKMIKTDSTINWGKISKKFNDKTVEFLKGKWEEKIKLGLACALRGGPWTKEEDELLKENVKKYGDVSWKLAHQYVPTRTAKQWADRWNKFWKKKIDIKEDTSFISDIKWNPSMKFEKPCKFIKNESKEESKTHANENKSKHIKRVVKEERKDGTKKNLKEEKKFRNNKLKSTKICVSKSHDPSKWCENDERILLQLYQKYGPKWTAFKEALIKYEIDEIKNHFIHILRNIADLNSWISDDNFDSENEDILKYLPKASKVLNADPDKLPTWIKILINNLVFNEDQNEDLNSSFIDQIRYEFNSQNDGIKSTKFSDESLFIKKEEIELKNIENMEKSNLEEQENENQIKHENKQDTYKFDEIEISQFMNKFNK